MRVRRISALTLAAVAVGLSLTACGKGGDSASPSPSSSSSASTGTARPATATARTSHGSPHAKPSGTPKKPGVSCTNQIDYAGDARSNAEINTIGERTGYCPPVQH